MGIVQPMADKTARASGDLLDFRGRFRDRLDALARVQGLLSRLNDHDRVTFDEFVQYRAYRDGRQRRSRGRRWACGRAASLPDHADAGGGPA